MATKQDPVETGSRVRGTRSELIERNLPLVESVARRFQRSGEPLEDLVQVGTIGLIKAVDRFDPARGNRFSTLAVPAIEGEIRHHLRDGASLVRTPRPLQELAARARAAQTRLTAELGREPTLDELAAAVGSPSEELALALGRGPAERVETSEQPADEVAGEHAGESRLLLDGRLDSLSEREQRILRLRYEKDLSQAEIARREGVSQATVSRLIRDALERLRRSIESGDDVAPTERGAYSRPVATAPQQVEDNEPRPAHSGRLLVRMPATLHDELANAAEREGVSLNTLVTGALAGAVGWRDRDGEYEDPEGELGSGRPDTLRRVLLANVIVVGLAALAAIALLVAAWSGGI